MKDNNSSGAYNGLPYKKSVFLRFLLAATIFGGASGCGHKPLLEREAMVSQDSRKYFAEILGDTATLWLDGHHLMAEIPLSERSGIIVCVNREGGMDLSLARRDGPKERLLAVFAFHTCCGQVTLETGARADTSFWYSPPPGKTQIDSLGWDVRVQAAGHYCDMTSFACEGLSEFDLRNASWGDELVLRWAIGILKDAFNLMKIKCEIWRLEQEFNPPIESPPPLNLKKAAYGPQESQAACSIVERNGEIGVLIRFPNQETGLVVAGKDDTVYVRNWQGDAAPFEILGKAGKILICTDDNGWAPFDSLSRAKREWAKEMYRMYISIGNTALNEYVLHNKGAVSKSYARASRVFYKALGELGRASKHKSSWDTERKAWPKMQTAPGQRLYVPQKKFAQKIRFA